MRRRAAAAQTFGGSDRSTTTDGGTTDAAVLLESWPDVDDRAESDDDVQVGAAGVVGSAVGRMQVLEEVIDKAADLRRATVAGVLPTDGRVQRRLEKELELVCQAGVCQAGTMGGGVLLGWGWSR